MAHIRAGRYEEALSNFESALVQDPENPLVSLAVGETLFQLERYEEALVEFERALSLSEDGELKAEALYKKAGITNPRTQIDAAELWATDLPPLTSLFGRTVDPAAAEVRRRLIDEIRRLNAQIEDDG